MCSRHRNIMGAPWSTYVRGCSATVPRKPQEHIRQVACTDIEVYASDATWEESNFCTLQPTPRAFSNSFQS